MNIFEFKKLLAPVENDTSISTADNEAVIKIKDYLKKFKDEDELAAEHIYQVLQLTPHDNDSVLFTTLKREFDHHHLFAICELLHANDRLHEMAFSMIYYNLGLDEEDVPEVRNFLWRLISNDNFKISAISKESPMWLLFIISRIVKQKKDFQLFEQCLCFMSRWNQLDMRPLNFLISQKNSDHRLLHVFELCDNTDYPWYHFDHYSKNLLKHLATIDELIKRLKEAGIAIVKDLMSAIIIKSESTFFELLQPNTYYPLLINFINISNKFTIESYFWSLLFKKDMAGQLLFYKLIEDLDKEKLLDQVTFDQYVKRLIFGSLSILDCGNDMELLVNTLNDNKIILSKEVMLSFYIFSKDTFLQLSKNVVNLANMGLLNELSFNKAFARITKKLPPIEALVIKKDSRKVTKEARSHIESSDGKYNFFISHDKKPEKGAFGVIKKGYNTVTSSVPLYGIKKITDSVRREYDDGLHDAAREVKCNRLLNRKSDYYATPCNGFSRSYFYRVISPWHDGKDLDKYAAAELMQSSYEDRLQCLSLALAELNTLHQHNRIHGDLKPLNFILNLKSKSMHIIDFGGSIKFGSGKIAAHTNFFNEYHSWGQHFHSDLYAMGIIAKMLFPELYRFDNQHKTSYFLDEVATFTLLKQSNLSIIEKAIIQLIDAMQHQDKNIRCTSEDASSYCKKIIEKLTHLDDIALDEIIQSTIARTNATVEDILREARVNKM